MSSSPNHESQMLQNIINDYIREKRSTRRWKLFFRLSYLIILIVILANIFSEHRLKHGSVLGVVELKDEISHDNKTYDNLLSGLKSAFKDNSVGAVVIKANSPGGSPVYSNMINKAIYQLKHDYPKKPLYFVIEDVCASGCYYAAVAADKIYANPDSIVGSIGVISTSFGATELIKKLGIESRLQVAGKYKAIGYPFQENKSEYINIHQQILNIVHKEFIEAVKLGRGRKLAADSDIFTGRYWLGTQALALGLVDGLSSVEEIARQMHNATVVDYTPAQSTFDKLLKKIALTMFGNDNRMLSQKAILM